MHGFQRSVRRYRSLPVARNPGLVLRGPRRNSARGDVWRYTWRGKCLLTDSKASLSRIETELERHSQCNTEDTVVIAFSGQGSETHELIVHDTDYADINGTALSLDRLQKLFSGIPARRVILFLDCWFSGGLGTKVLQVPAVPRSLASTETRLQNLAGDGHLIFTASGVSEEAWEFSSHGHGLLTYYLLEALRGPAEIIEGERLSVYRMLEYVTSRVRQCHQWFAV